MERTTSDLDSISEAVPAATPTAAAGSLYMEALDIPAATNPTAKTAGNGAADALSNTPPRRCPRCFSSSRRPVPLQPAIRGRWPGRRRAPSPVSDQDHQTIHCNLFAGRGAPAVFCSAAAEATPRRQESPKATRRRTYPVACANILVACLSAQTTELRAAHSILKNDRRIGGRRLRLDGDRLAVHRTGFHERRAGRQGACDLR